uniref:hypothetical protein n=1 Tax=Prevotella nigrescens TaxID=28133 RepID=UPI0028D04EA8
RKQAVAVNKTYEEFILYNSMLSVVFLLEHWVDYTGKEDKPNGRDILYQFVPATNLPPPLILAVS